MLEVSTSDRETLSQVLARAFSQDPILRWLLPEHTTYQPFAETYFQIALANSIKAGASFTNEERNGVALWMGPNDKHTPLTALLSSLRTLWLLKSNIPRAYELQEIMANYRPRKDFLHLTHLATSPESQGSGVAKRLLEPMLEQATALNLPVYLECSNQDNLSFYRQFGFRVIDNVSITDGNEQGPTIWLMTLDF